MNEQRRQILQMLSEGKINADEGERLLDALGPESPAGAQVSSHETQKSEETKDSKKCKTLHVIVHEHGEKDRGDKVHVKVPLVMLKAGMKLNSLIPDRVFEKLNTRLSEKGLGNIDEKMEKLDKILDSLDQGGIDIDSDDGHVHIFCD